MLRLRWSNIIHRITTSGPYVDERISIVVLTLVVAVGLSAVAYAEKSVPSFSFAPLYILPLALSALVHPLRVSLVLAAICLSLHDVLGPAPKLSIQHVTKDIITLFGFFFVVIVVNQLGTQRKRLAARAERERDDLAREIQMAAEVQQNILPRSVPTVPGFELAARMYPAKIVAGDYYGFIELPKGEIGLVIADVSGKGVAAGLLMPSIEVVLQMDAPRFRDTRDLLRSFNKVVYQITDGSRFISLFYGKLCPQSRTLQYTNAGHNPPLLIRVSLDPILLDKGGPVLGLLPPADYQSDKIELRSGDVLVLYTDGTVEAENPAGEEYSARRLATVVSSHLDQSPSELITMIHASVVEFAETPHLADDLTVLVLKTL
jgi:sigma-B regulation protein RsbU (phosphoserine phosphatase)